MKKIYVVSDCTSMRNYEIEEAEGNNILNLAMKYGRGETGEIVDLYEDDVRVARCYWDSQYRKYRCCKEREEA